MAELDPKDKQRILSILEDLGAVQAELYAVSKELESRYRTVGGELFNSPFEEIKKKCRNAAGELQRLL
jgi:hypothetical protein